MSVTLASIKRSEQWAHIGGLSQPSKMPCFGYSIPAEKCATGSKLRPVEGSTCNSCYAFKGRYPMANVQAAMWRRWDSLQVDLDLWTDSFIWILQGLASRGEKYFRWHDSGDIQSIEHLQAIVWIARAVPEIQFWIPTREFRFVHAFTVLQGRELPSNLTIRISAPMVGQSFQSPISGTVASTVGASEIGAQCPAYNQGGECRDCRACWDQSIPVVNYPLH